MMKSIKCHSEIKGNGKTVISGKFQDGIKKKKNLSIHVEKYIETRFSRRVKINREVRGGKCTCDFESCFCGGRGYDF